MPLLFSYIFIFNMVSKISYSFWSSISIGCPICLFPHPKGFPVKNLRVYLYKPLENCVLSLKRVFVKESYEELWLQNRVLSFENALLNSQNA